MDPFFIWLEATALSVWMRESISVFAFPGILSVHTVGMGFVAGLSAAMGLRILGLAPRVPLLELQRFFPLLWIAFWLNAVSGVLLLIAYPTKALTNPLFYFKLILIALAVAAVRAIRKSVFADQNLDLNPVPPRGRQLAAATMFLWAAAITAGRLLAYTYTRLTASQ